MLQETIVLSLFYIFIIQISNIIAVSAHSLNAKSSGGSDRELSSSLG